MYTPTLPHSTQHNSGVITSKKIENEKVKEWNLGYGMTDTHHYATNVLPPVVKKLPKNKGAEVQRYKRTNHHRGFSM